MHEAGIKEFIFIVGYLAEKIESYVRLTYPNLTCHFVHQNERQGTGHAIQLARHLVGNEPIFVALGDTICEYDVKEMVNSPHNVLAVKKVDDPRNFGVAELDADGFIAHVVEKPAIPKSNLALVGLYKIVDTKALYGCVHKLFEDDIKELRRI